MAQVGDMYGKAPTSPAPAKASAGAQKKDVPIREVVDTVSVVDFVPAWDHIFHALGLPNKRKI